ncbi:MAG: hypothetical protein APF78_08310 [Sphingomonadales bacterium BRH_c3]|nr:MAG: hypothetical protein APF78_08310 [Sphingomonadales bacterium BRH_c3]
METYHSILFSKRLEIGEQIGDIAVFEYEDWHFHRMAYLNSTLERRLYRPIRQTVGRTTKAWGVRIGGNPVIKCVTTGTVCLGKCPSFGCIFRERIRIAIGHASSDEERS